MKILGVTCAVFLVVALALGVRAGGFSTTVGLGAGTVVVSNSQANSSWVPVAVMIRYAAPCAGTVEVRRVSQELTIVLDCRAFTNATSVVWVPEAAYSFGYGDFLVVESSATNGVVQIMRRGD